MGTTEATAIKDNDELPTRCTINTLVHDWQLSHHCCHHVHNRIRLYTNGALLLRLYSNGRPHPRRRGAVEYLFTEEYFDNSTEKQQAVSSRAEKESTADAHEKFKADMINDAENNDGPVPLKRPAGAIADGDLEDCTIRTILATQHKHAQRHASCMFSHSQDSEIFPKPKPKAIKSADDVASGILKKNVAASQAAGLYYKCESCYCPD